MLLIGSRSASLSVGMSRYQRRSDRRAPSSSGSLAQGESVALELFYDSPLRVEAERRLRDYLKQLRAAQRSLQRFEEADLPEFDRWKAVEFGKRLTELRELEAEWRSLASLVEEVETMRFFTNRSYRSCYEEVKYRREHPEERFADGPGPGDSDGERANSDGAEPESGRGAAGGGRRDARTAEEREEELKDAFADLLGFECDFDDPDVAHVFAQFKRRFGFDEDDAVSASMSAGKASGTAELKRAYRLLARKLHPDHREELGALEAGRLDALWHEAQDAYRRGDLEELQRIDAIIDIEIDGVTSATELERIEQAAERHRQSLRAVERVLRQARKQPAWMFSKKPALKSRLRALIDRDLREGIAYYRFQVDRFQTQIRKWEPRPSGKKPRPSARTMAPRRSGSSY